MNGAAIMQSDAHYLRGVAELLEKQGRHGVGMRLRKIAELIEPLPGDAEKDEDEVPRAAWRVGQHYGIHVYEGERPIATFHTVSDARLAVQAHNAYGAVAGASLGEPEETT